MTDATPMATLLLDLDQWDLVLDANGNIAVAAPPYSMAQDVASAARTFLGEVWFDTTDGVPYFQKILGKTPPITDFQQYLVDAALTVPGVVSATCVIEAITERAVTGQIQFTDVNGTTQTVAL